MQQSPTTFAEVFPIKVEFLPPLFGYELDIRGSNLVYIGRRLADRLGRQFPGHWIWTQNILATDLLQDNSVISDAVRQIRITESDTFKDLNSIVLIDGWQPDAQSQADFMAFGLFADLNHEIEAVLAPTKQNLDGKATVERDYEVRGWVVKGQPSVSISIDSRVIFNQDLRGYASKIQDADDLIGLNVADKIPLENGKVYKGEILEIVGRLDIEVSRQSLLDIAKKEGSKPIIREAPKGEFVVRVGYSELEYVLGALRIILYPKHYRRFGINTKNAQKATWITPENRYSLVQKISQIAKIRGLIGDEYTSNQSGLFFPASKFKYDSTILIGNGKTLEYNSGNLLTNLKNSGLYYRIPELGILDNRLRVGIVNTTSKSVTTFQELLEGQLNKLGFFIDTPQVVKTSDTSRVSLERAIHQLLPSEPHLLIGILPGANSNDEEDWSPYLDFKSLTMDLVPTQVIDTTTLDKELTYVMPNLVLGILSKLGNIPYVLAHSIDYADIVVGIDIARKRKKRGGSQNAAAFAHISQKAGQFISCKVIETSLEGETVPAHVLRSLFPLNEYTGKTVIIHRDGLFRGDEKQILREHAEQIGAVFYFVEVIKHGSPRLYLRSNQVVEAPHLGTAFLISDTEAFLVASFSSTATPNPIHIRTEEPCTIGKALHSVFSLTLLHYGSLRRPRIPVSVHFSDKIGYLALRGVKPRSGQSNEMYWL